MIVRQLPNGKNLLLEVLAFEVDPLNRRCQHSYILAIFKELPENEHKVVSVLLYNVFDPIRNQQDLLLLNGQNHSFEVLLVQTYLHINLVGVLGLELDQLGFRFPPLVGVFVDLFLLFVHFPEMLVLLLYFFETHLVPQIFEKFHQKFIA